jgi:hypothetical protein
MKVLEETGYEISRSQIREEDHIKIRVKKRPIKLYIVPFVPENTLFKPRTHKEIAVTKHSNTNQRIRSQHLQ